MRKFRPGAYEDSYAYKNYHRKRSKSKCASRLGHSGLDFSMVVACFCHFRLKTLAFFVFGILLGFSFAMCIRNIAHGPGAKQPDCHSQSLQAQRQTAAVERSEKKREISVVSRDLAYIGIMTAEKYLSTRATAINQTWASLVPGRLQFFVGNDVDASKYAHLDLPLVRLAHVSDSMYPPQKKSFLMLKHMWERQSDQGRQFDWFIRADDDAYIRGDRLELLLRSLNASNAIYMGQTGLGNKEEYGHLSLGDQDNYCMGGTGMIFSRALMERLVPHLGECLAELYSTHEDVELGRCVRKHVGVSCTWAYEMQKIFYNAPKGSSILAFPVDHPSKASSLTSPSSDLSQSIILHPAKDPSVQRQLYLHFRRRKALDLGLRMLQLARDLNESQRSLPSLSYLTHSKSDLLPWNYLSSGVEFCTGKVNCPRHNVPSHYKCALSGVVEEVLQNINKHARQRGRTLEYQDTLYGYSRVHPSVGAQYVLDLLLTYKKFRGKRINVPVRRHAYVQQTFGEVRARVIHRRTDPSSSIPDSDTVHIVVPLKGRLEIFVRFLSWYETEILDYDENASLRIVLFQQESSDPEFVSNLVNDLQSRHPDALLTVLQQPDSAHFSRGFALMQGIRDLSDGALLFLTDVDVLLTRDFMTRLRSNVVRGQRVYYPTVFSEYRPLSRDASGYTSADEWSNHFPEIFSHNQGYFRHFGYGLVSLYKSDLSAIGNYDLSIVSWGFEDVDVFDRTLKNTNITILRCPDPGLVHVYHPVHCGPELTKTQQKMCAGSLAASFASQKFLAQIVRDGALSLLNSSL